MTIGLTLAPRYSGVVPSVRACGYAGSASALASAAMAVRSVFFIFVLPARKTATWSEGDLVDGLEDDDGVRILAYAARRDAHVARADRKRRRRRHGVEQLRHVARLLRRPLDRQLAGELAVKRAFHRVGDIGGE